MEEEYADVDWDNLGFGITPADYMYSVKASKDGNFERGQLFPYKNLELSPSAGVLNYGQVSFSFLTISSFSQIITNFLATSL